MDLHSTKEKVRHLLRTQPETRDDDQLLILKVWAIDYPELRNSNFTFVEFSKIWLRGDLPPAESIRRCRQKLQEHDVSLQGKKYAARHKHQSDVKDQLGDPSFKPGGTP